MTEKSEALRLADALRDSVETDGEWSQEQVVAAAAELRRQHEENEAFGIHLSERMKDLAKVEAQRDALLEALKMARLMLIAHGETHAKINAAIKAVEGEKT